MDEEYVTAILKDVRGIFWFALQLVRNNSIGQGRNVNAF